MPYAKQIGQSQTFYLIPTLIGFLIGDIMRLDKFLYFNSDVCYWVNNEYNSETGTAFAVQTNNDLQITKLYEEITKRLDISSFFIYNILVICGIYARFVDKVPSMVLYYFQLKWLLEVDMFKQLELKRSSKNKKYFHGVNLKEPSLEEFNKYIALWNDKYESKYQKEKVDMSWNG